MEQKKVLVQILIRQVREMERQIKLAIEENAAVMARILASGKDIELRKSKDGISFAEVTKRVVKKEYR